MYTEFKKRFKKYQTVKTKTIMKKNILTLGALILANVSLAQWTNKNINNGFDEPYKICHTKENNKAVLKLENVDGEVAFYLQGGYFCDDYLNVDISLMVNGIWKRYSVTGEKSTDSKAVFLINDLTNSEMVIDFLNSTSIKLRVNETYCETEYYQFNMSGSTSAYNFIK
jgi:hypothetical protein